MDGIYVPEDGSMFGLVAAAPGLPAREVLVRGRSSRTRPTRTRSNLYAGRGEHVRYRRDYPIFFN